MLVLLVAGIFWNTVKGHYAIHFCVLFFEARSYGIQANLKLTTEPRMAMNPETFASTHLVLGL